MAKVIDMSGNNNGKPGHEFGTGQYRGIYATACEMSPHKQQIDMWLNEHKSYSFISKELERLGEHISDNSIGKYARYREEYIQQQLAEDPAYQAKIQVANQIMIDSTSKIKEIDALKHISDIIVQTAKLVDESLTRENPVAIKSVTDLRLMQMTLLDSIRLYGDTVLKMQRFGKVEEDPSLLKPGNSGEVQSVIKAILEELPPDVRFAVIDKLRNGSIGTVGG